MQQHGAVWSGMALPEHAQSHRAPGKHQLGITHIPECQELLWKQP